MPDIRLIPLHAGQREIYRNRAPRSVVRCGRRYGKTTMFEQWSANWAMHGKRVGFFAPHYKLMTPSYSRILKALRPAVESASKVDSMIELKTGGAIEFWTLNDPDAGRSRRYHEVIIDEASLAPGLRDIFEQSIAPTLLDFNGNATMGGTPKGIDEESFFYQACTNKVANDEWPEPWREFYAPTSANPMLDAIAVAGLQAKNAPLVWAQEYDAQFVSWAGQAFFSLEKMLVSGAGVPLPQHCDYVYAVIDSAMKDGSGNDGTAVVYCARSAHVGHPLVILDWDIVQINSDLLTTWLPGVITQLEHYAKICRARGGSAGAFIEDKASGITLNQYAARVGIPARPIDGSITTQGKDGRAILASGPVYREEVRLSQLAYEKVTTYKGVTRNHLVSQVCSYTLGDKDAAKRSDDLYDAFAYSVIVGLGGAEGF